MGIQTTWSKCIFAVTALLLFGGGPLSGQCEEPTMAVPFEFPPTPPHTSTYVSRTFPPGGLEFDCNSTTCEYAVFQAAGDQFPLHDVFSSLIGDGNDQPYFAVDGERAVFRHKFSPTEAGYFEDAVVLSSTQDGETNCRIQPLAGRTAPGLCVYINEDQAGGFGHTYMQLLPTGGSYSGADFLSYGLYPAGILGDGELNNESLNAWDGRICFRLAETQYDQARNLLNSNLDAPPNYSLFTQNCQHHVLGNARSIGITELDGLLTLLRPWEKIQPVYLLGKLREVGHGNRLSPFAVVELNDNNNRRTQPQYVQPFPRAVSANNSQSYSMLINGDEHPALEATITMPDPEQNWPGPFSFHPGFFFPALRDPHTLAATIGMPLHEVTLPDVHVSVGETIIAETLENGMSAIHWGHSPVEELAWDNVNWDEVRFPSEVGAGTYFHSYNKGGNYPVTMAALWTNNRIYVYRWNFIVGEAASEKAGLQDIDIPLPEDPLFPWENGPFTPPISPIHPDDVFFDGFETGDTSRWN